jgi:RHS repeat-associated protein
MYDEYGRVEATINQSEQNIRFQGQYEDDETGLFYNRFRYYDTDSSRYINQDPISFLGDWCLYLYTNNPVNSIDPYGLTWEPGTPKPKGWRLPKEGTWAGEKGHSDFTPSNPKSLGLNPGDSIPYKNGMPDFSNWSQRNMRVSGMTGVHDTDMSKIHAALAKRMGLPNQTAAKNWLSANKLTPHHAGGSKVILVATALHDGIRHTGGAHDLRNKKTDGDC